VIGQSWVFKKEGSAKKFNDLIASIIKRDDEDWSAQINKAGLKVAVSNQDPFGQQTLNKLNNLARAHHGSMGKTIHEGLEEGEEGLSLKDAKKQVRAYFKKKSLRVKITKGRGNEMGVQMLGGDFPSEVTNRAVKIKYPDVEYAPHGSITQYSIVMDLDHWAEFLG
jgi:hypothetical protein